MRKTLVLDANLLVLLTVGLADARFIARHKRLNPNYRKEHLDDLLEIIKRWPELATTTHALTEASNLLRQCADPMRSQIMIELARLIKSSGELTPEASQAADAPEFIRLGLTDAAFTLLDPERYVIATVDLDLIVALEVRGFEVVNFNTFLYQ